MQKIYLRNLSAILLCLFTFNISAQDINDIGAAKVNKLKQEGRLTGNEQYTNRVSTAPNFRVSPPITNQVNTQTSCNCWIPRDTSFHICQFDGSGASGGPGLPPDYRNDDWSTTLMTLPFNICFYGANVNQVYINNNGNVSIGAAYSTFTASSFPSSTYTMIAPFWADVDTRGLLSGLVYYKLTPTSLIVQWDHVGYYSSHDTLLNTFQLIITDGIDPLLPPGQNVNFCYKDMQWSTGDASGGVLGFGGTPATVGVNQGNGTDYIQFGLFDQSGAAYDGPYGLNDGVDWLDGQTFTINACVNSANIPPVLNSLNVCDTIRLCENTTYTLTANYLSPEQAEITHISYNNLGGMTGITVVSNDSGNTASIVLQIVGQTSNLGFHTINLTAIDNGTPHAATNNNFVIEVMPAPLPSFTYLPASPVQANTPVVFTNTTGTPGTLYSWDFGDNTATTTSPNPTHTYTIAGTYTISLSASFPNGCTTVITQQITITSCTPATFTTVDVCAGTGSTITYTALPSPNAVYVWNFDGGNVISGSGSGPYSVSWNTGGNYNVSLTVTEATCSSSVTMPVNVFAIPLASITPVSQLCVGDSPNVDFNGTAGATAVYTWTFGGAAILSGSGSGPYNVQYNNAGQDLITLLVTENGCADSTQINVQVYPIPTANFTIPAASCANDALAVNYTGTATGAANYNWDFNGANVTSGSGQGPYSVNWSTGGNYNVVLTVSENGCTSPPINMPVAVTDVPVVSISNVPALCVGDASNVNFTGLAGLAAAYNWNFGTAAVLSGSGSGPYNLQWNSVGQFQVQLTVTENNCSASADINITVNPIPTSDFVINNAACINQPVTLGYTGTASPAATYAWVLGAGNVISGTGSGPYTLTWNTQGVYQISLVVTENGCISPQTDLQAIVNPLPIVFAGTDQLACPGVVVSIGGPANPGEIYQWSPTTNLSDPTISDPTATPINNTNVQQQVSYILTTTDANGCINTDTVEVAAQPQPIVGFQPVLSQCIDGNNFLFSAFANIASGVNFNWQFTPQASTAVSTQPSLSVTYSAVGTYPVLLTADYSGCPAQPYVDSVTIYAMPVSNLAPMVTQGCKPLTVPFTNLSTGDGNTYVWHFGDGSTDNLEIPTHTFLNPGVYGVSLTAVNKHGCSADTTYNNIITVFDFPHGNFLPNPPVANILSPIIQFQNYSTNVLTYVWDFGDLDTSHSWSPNHTYAAIGTYPITLSLISPDGCIDTIRGVVKVEDNFSFYIPNSFTPNGDGVNDVFKGYGIAFDNFTMNIYDRWGKLIFNTNDYSKPWDGRMKSGEVQSDTYVYHIVIKDEHGEMHTFVGDVSVVY